MGFNANWSMLKIILPVGISFYTFQSLGYVIDVYRGQSPACSDLLTFATFDAFFPQMVSGPIERGRNLIPQLEKGASFQDSHVQDGLRLMLVGFFKKVFVADNCAILANYAFDPQTSLNGYWAVMGVVAFAFQIYADFSGYTDIARGSAKLLGIDLMENFQFPYFSRTPSEFWGQVAHFAVHLVPGLPVHPFGRQSRRQVGDPAESGHRHAPGRPVARRQLGLCPLGGLSRRPAHSLPGAAAVQSPVRPKTGPGPGATSWRCP